MRVGLFASQRHYYDHLQPIWDALPDELHGNHRPPETMGLRNRFPDDDYTLVASYHDYLSVNGPVIFVEHGAGQTYVGLDVGNYAGGEDRDRVCLFIVPNQQVADRNEARYDAPNAIAGCPKLDRWHTGRTPALHATTDLVVGITFHWPCMAIPEAETAFYEYERVLADLGAEPYKVLGHGHPRWLASLLLYYDKAGIEYTPDTTRILDECDILIVDNSSIGYEFASLDKPVVWLNSSRYRRDVEHGLRFWDTIPGLQVNDPDRLTAAVRHTIAVGHDPEQKGVRRRATDRVYAHSDGTATARAVGAIMDLVGH